MFAYCNNNPSNLADPAGTISSAITCSLISGCIGAVTNLVCTAISGGTLGECMVQAGLGFIGGVSSVMGYAIALASSVEMGLNIMERTGNAPLALLGITSTFALSFFTGSNIGKLPGVFVDDAGALFFDAFFGFQANLYYTTLTAEELTVPSGKVSTKTLSSTSTIENAGSGYSSRPLRKSPNFAQINLAY